MKKQIFFTIDKKDWNEKTPYKFEGVKLAQKEAIIGRQRDEQKRKQLVHSMIMSSNI